VGSFASQEQLEIHPEPEAPLEEDAPQDIQEVWFPGGHADIGGGWMLTRGETWPLSHVPLVWMVQEAQRAGLQFDERKLKQFECCEEFSGDVTPIKEAYPFQHHTEQGENIAIEVQDSSQSRGDGENLQVSTESRTFQRALEHASTRGHLHDCLKSDCNLSMMSVLLWQIMEYLPFRRMDLQADGSWKPIRWPLPFGEVRDIPANAQIHNSAIRRMKADENYRPGNLIVGGGGRGVRTAPEHLGIGQWEVIRDEGDSVREVYVRKCTPKLNKGENGVKNEKL
jgi:hypothetical protein